MKRVSRQCVYAIACFVVRCIPCVSDWLRSSSSLSPARTRRQEDENEDDVCATRSPQAEGGRGMQSRGGASNVTVM